MPGKKLLDIPHPGDQWTLKGNCYYTFGDQVQIKWGDKTFKSLEEWRRATGQEQHDGTDIGIEADPGLTSHGQGGTIGDHYLLDRLDAYKLKQSSVLVDLGLDLRSTFGIDMGIRDFYNNQIPQGGLFDIGVHEYEKASSGQ